jgi:aspartate/methionine/tyrosine aminotransferase
MHITPFAVEMWMNAWETRCTLNLAETCVDSLTVAQLLDLAGANAGDLSALLPMKLTYGEIPGSDRLRDAIAGLYAAQARDNVVVTHGTIGANMLVHQALVSPGDRVVAVVPTYQQHYSIPESLGATVVPLHLRAENGWLPDMDELARLATPGTRLIALTNPNNPTGALIDRAGLERIADIARAAGAWVLCDEVYRGTDQEGPGATASMADIYEKGISTAGMSKAFSLAGLRLGWVVAPPEVVEHVMIHRDYNTISVGMIDDHLAAMALGAKDRVLGRSRAITRANLAILSDWVDHEPRASLVRPRSGTTAFVRLDIPMGSEEFCRRLLEETGVLFTPGAAFDIEGHVRIGYACATDVLREGLARTSAFLARIHSQPGSA